MYSRRIAAAICVFAIGMLAASVARVAARATGHATATVARVVDGDTFVTTGGDTVRLVQIDTPESSDVPECGGGRAAAWLRARLPPGTLVELEADADLDGQDQYGRQLRWVREGGTLLQLELVSNGLAAPWYFDGVVGRYGEQLWPAAVAARSVPRGVWRHCPAATLQPRSSWETGPASGSLVGSP